MKKNILFCLIVIMGLFVFNGNVKATNKLYFESENISVAPGKTTEVGLFVESDKEFKNIKLNLITTSASINFYSVEYNQVFTRSTSGSITVLSSNDSLKSGTKIATVKLKASDNAPVSTTGYVRAVSATLDNSISLENAQVLVKVSNELSNNTNLSSITSSLVNIDFNKETTNYEVEVESDVKELDLVATPEDKSSTAFVSSQVLKTGKNTITITVKAANKEEKVYTITVDKKKDKENTVKSDSPKVHKEAKVDKKGWVIILLALLIVLGIDLVNIMHKKNK